MTPGRSPSTRTSAPSTRRRTAVSDPAVKAMTSMAIKACLAAGKYVGICGQGPSDHPDLAEWLVDQGIETMSLNPDTVVETWLRIARRANATA